MLFLGVGRYQFFSSKLLCLVTVGFLLVVGWYRLSVATTVGCQLWMLVSVDIVVGCQMFNGIGCLQVIVSGWLFLGGCLWLIVIYLVLLSNVIKSVIVVLLIDSIKCLKSDTSTVFLSALHPPCSSPNACSILPCFYVLLDCYSCRNILVSFSFMFCVYFW
jgi:hypothetical protein